MGSGTPGEVTILLQQIGDGSTEAIDQLLPLVLQELRQLARLYLAGERPGHTLQPTALVRHICGWWGIKGGTGGTGRILLV